MKIESMEDQCEVLFLDSASVRELMSLRKTHKDPRIKLFETDDVMVRDSKNGHGIEVLKSQIKSTESKLKQLNTSPECQRLIALEKELGASDERKEAGSPYRSGQCATTSFID